MGRPPVPDSLAGERGAGDLAGCSGRPPRRHFCQRRAGIPLHQQTRESLPHGGPQMGRRYQIPEQTGEGHQISTRRLGSLKTSRWM